MTPKLGSARGDTLDLAGAKTDVWYVKASLSWHVFTSDCDSEVNLIATLFGIWQFFGHHTFFSL